MISGGVTLVMAVAISLFGKPGIRIFSPLIALASGYLTSWAFGSLDLTHTMQAPWFGMPQGRWPGLYTSLDVSHLPVFIAFVMATMASAVENTGNIMLIQEKSQREFASVSYPKVQAGLYCDTAAKALSGLLTAPAPSTYCDNIPVMVMTGVTSRLVGVLGAAILLLLAFMPKIVAFILNMPGPVIGGFLVAMGAILFQSGLDLLLMTRFNSQTGLILGLSLCMGILAGNSGFFSKIMPDFLSPLLKNSVSVGGFTAFILSAACYLTPKPCLHFTVPARTEALRDVMKRISDGHRRLRLRLTDEDLGHLQLCCEEAFLHAVASTPVDGGSMATFRIQATEDGCFTEIVSGHEVDDMNNFLVPYNLLNAGNRELENLGLFLLNKFAKDIKQIYISGYSYISFVV
jgi:hypothetical protein